MTEKIVFNPRSPDFRANPIDVYRSLRARGEIFRGEDGNWVAVSYKASSAILSDPNRIVKASEWRLSRIRPGRFHDYNRHTMAFMDKPEHPRVRSAVAPAFGPAAMKQLSSKIEALCDELIHPLAGKPEFDFIAEFAGPFPLYVICDILGIPRDHRELFRDGAHKVVAALEPLASDELIAAADEACARLGEVLTSYSSNREADPEGDLVSFLKAQHESSVLSWDEFINQMIFILVAGHETTATLLSQGLRAFIDHPEIAAGLRADPTKMNTAVSELLRLHPPLQFVLRYTAEPIAVGDVTVPQGEPIFILIGAANRDPEMFPEPDTLNLERANAGRHLAFAAGPHTCLGNNLARLEARIAFERLLAAFPDLRFSSRPQPNANFLFQGYATMPVAHERAMSA